MNKINKNKIRPLTPLSVQSYQKILEKIIDIPLLEIFLKIGVNLIELYPREQYIHILISEIQEKHTATSIEDLNMRLFQVQNFYNDSIASYENIDMDKPEELKVSKIEKVVSTMMDMVSKGEAYRILASVIVEALETVAYEYRFDYELFNMSDEELDGYLKNEVFRGADALYVNYSNMLRLRDMLLDEQLDEQELFVSTLFLIVHLSAFNLVRKERFTLEQEESKKPKIGRNDPCPCGSGKKYKKCCMNK